MWERQSIFVKLGSQAHNKQAVEIILYHYVWLRCLLWRTERSLSLAYVVRASMWVPIYINDWQNSDDGANVDNSANGDQNAPSYFVITIGSGSNYCCCTNHNWLCPFLFIFFLGNVLLSNRINKLLPSVHLFLPMFSYILVFLIISKSKTLIPNLNNDVRGFIDHSDN